MSDTSYPRGSTRFMCIVVLLLALGMILSATAGSMALIARDDPHGNSIVVCIWPSSEPDQAIAACTSLINTPGEPDDSRALAYHQRGMAHAQKGELDPAVADLNEAIMLNPKLAQAYLVRALVEARKGQQDFRARTDWTSDNSRASADFDRAVRLDPTLAAAIPHFAIATAYGDTEATCGTFKAKGAKGVYERAGELDSLIVLPNKVIEPGEECNVVSVENHLGTATLSCKSDKRDRTLWANVGPLPESAARTVTGTTRETMVWFDWDAPAGVALVRCASN